MADTPLSAPPGPDAETPQFRTPEVPPASVFATRLALAIVTLALVAVGTAAWLDNRRELSSVRNEVARRLGDAEEALRRSRERETAIAGDLREAQAKLSLLEARLAESQSQQSALEALYRDLSPSRDDLALSEIEQVLYLASQQLALAGNVQGALAALQLADAKLARSDRPQFGALRRALARDIDRLKSVPFADVAGLSLRLDQAITLVDALPLASDERLPQPSREPETALMPRWERLLREFGRELRSLVRIEISDRPPAALLAPREEYFLRENLRLRLLSARVSLAARQEASFRADVKAAQAWLAEHFDPRAKAVRVVHEALVQMAAAPLPVELPDLGASLEAVRNLTAAQDRNPETAAAGSAQPSARLPKPPAR
jgi:uroporphyrin-3 C-methyltransferase